MRYRCLVLDHDDTVVQSEATINYPCFCETLAQIRPQVQLSLEEYHRGCFDPGFLEMCRQWYGFTEQELNMEYESWQAYMQTHLAPPFPGIERIIRRQREAGGLVCVVSQSHSKYIRRDYEAHFGMQPDMVFGCDLPSHQQKPNPYPLEKIMETYGLQPQELLVVDDLLPAWDMARKVGVPFCFARWSKQSMPLISQRMTELCDYIFDSTEALERFLFD